MWTEPGDTVMMTWAASDEQDCWTKWMRCGRTGGRSLTTGTLKLVFAALLISLGSYLFFLTWDYSPLFTEPPMSDFTFYIHLDSGSLDISLWINNPNHASFTVDEGTRVNVKIGPKHSEFAELTSNEALTVPAKGETQVKLSGPLSMAALKIAPVLLNGEQSLWLNAFLRASGRIDFWWGTLSLVEEMELEVNCRIDIEGSDFTIKRKACGTSKREMNEAASKLENHGDVGSIRDSPVLMYGRILAKVTTFLVTTLFTTGCLFFWSAIGTCSAKPGRCSGVCSPGGPQSRGGETGIEMMPTHYAARYAP